MAILDYNKDTDSDWEKVAQSNPYWAVCSTDKFLTENLTPERREEFFKSGRDWISAFTEKWDNFNNKKLDTVLDFGAGTGRLLIPMAALANKAIGIEISESMVAEIGKNTKEQGAYNINIYKTVDEMIASNPGLMLDWINSYIVFQHIAPERGYEILDKLLGLLKIDGYFSLHFGIFKIKSTLPAEAAYQQTSSSTLSLLYGKRNETVGDLLMYDYDLNKIYYLMAKHGISEFGFIPETHGNDHTLMIYGRRREYTLLPTPTNYEFLKEYYTFSQAITKISGFSVPESCGTWTISNEAAVTFCMMRDSCGKELALSLTLHAFLDKTGKQKFNVYANAEKIGEFTVTKTEDSTYNMKIPSAATNQDRFLTIRFEVINPTSPEELGHSGDTRKLGLAISALTIRI